MNSVQAHWEDEENNRRIEFAVQATRGQDGVEIQSLTPQRVTFVCPHTNDDLRSVGVWTEKGRELLVDQLHNSGSFSDLEQQIESGLAV
ncbi:MAG: hypothetical protein AAGA92_14460 [Planctomycetota bacterium]